MPPIYRTGYPFLFNRNASNKALKVCASPGGQKTIKRSDFNGCVDAAIKVDRIVPIDSKFPLDNFERMTGAENDIERQQFEKLFARDVKSHVDAIASKYIRPDEGTLDFALMYVPAERVYYEAVAGDANADDPDGAIGYALRRRVIPVSPHTFYAYLAAILHGDRPELSTSPELPYLLGGAWIMALLGVPCQHLRWRILASF